MVSFKSDYTTGAHPAILKKLCDTNLESLGGYGTDIYCLSAKKKIREAVGIDNAQIEFISGGTQTNMVVISTLLRDHEGVLAPKTGHISTHESGAIEFTGHKVIELEAINGKIDALTVENYLKVFYLGENPEQTVFPGLLYLSYPTEYGTLYSKNELIQINEVCKKYDIPIFIDGARLSYGLMSSKSDLTLKELASLCDVFYIGGTKVGALCGEAVVFTKNNMPAYFGNSLKRRGAMLAKGRLLGIQFDVLFTDGLYFEIGRKADELAEKLKNIFVSRGYGLQIDSPTNQQFIILENERMKKLREKVDMTYWEKYDETHSVVRLATCWSTTDEDLEQLEKALDE